MAEKQQWEIKFFDNGLQIVELSSWRSFFDYINEVLLDYRTYIFRGQANENWKLDSTLDRLLRKTGKLTDLNIRHQHLNDFKKATRGRRGYNPREIKNENEWWALGQHHGLSTPLLDWTESPFVALYFAFIKKENEESESRVVYALAKYQVINKSAEIENKHGEQQERGRPPILEIVEPFSDENARLVSQRGLFARGPDGMSLENWVIKYFDGEKNVILSKFLIPNRGRTQCLRFLNRMNINHLSLFPDLYGASKYCNMDLLIDNY